MEPNNKNHCVGPTSPVSRCIVEVFGFRDLRAVEFQVNTSDKRNSEYTYIYSCTEVYYMTTNAAKTSMIHNSTRAQLRKSPSLCFQRGSRNRKGLYSCISTTRQLKGACFRQTD